jgi:hypothetical protein
MNIPVKIKICLTAFILLGVFGLVTLNYTGIFKLEVVTVNASVVETDNASITLNTGQPIVRQPLDSLANSLLMKNNVYKVDIDYKLPNAVDIKINNFQPACLVLDRVSKKLYGLNDCGRVIPLENAEYDWNNPILTSVTVGKMFDHCRDFRICRVVKLLVELKNKNMELYRLIDEIDFGNTGFLKVSIDGLPYRLKVRSHNLLDDLNRFVEFVSRFQPDLEGVRLMDLCFDDMIICSKGKK